VHLYSPGNRYDALYMRNYAVLNVRDVLARLPGMGDVQIFGGGDYAMRIWLDPQKLAALGLTAGDVISSIRQQNVQVAAGQIGAPPDAGADFQIALNVAGRLKTPQQFRHIVLKTGANGQVVRLGDVARVAMGAQAYAIQSDLDNRSAIAIPIFQAPGSNALKLSEEVRATMARLAKRFPPGLRYSIVYDPTIFVRHSIEAVLHTLLEAVLLVVLVVILFLQTWRASVIPLIAVPVSIIGTFAVLLACGFSINTLSLFGLVLAIGIVVDDAIVVVENVERHIESGLAPRQAAKAAMAEVSRPIVAITLVLGAVFVPVAFVSGLTGEFYRQFALTIAFSTLISAFNSLTLSPALAAVLLKPHGARPDALTRAMDRLLGGFFRRFNRVFARTTGAYSHAVGGIVRRPGIALAVYAGLIALTYLAFNALPHGFIPQQDKQYLIAVAQLPPAASVTRTAEVVKEIGAIGLRQPGVDHAVQFAGMSTEGYVPSSSDGLVFFTLKPFSERRTKDLSATAIAAALDRKLAAVQGGTVEVFLPPPVMGLGTLGGFKLEVEDRGDLGSDALYGALQKALRIGRRNPALAGLFSSYQVNVPQLDVNVNRTKVMQEHVNLDDVFQTLQIYLGSLYVNDFNAFGRTYEVVAQADAPFRSRIDEIPTLETRNAGGQMVPLGSFVSVSPSFGPAIVQRYDGYRAADINGGPAPGYSSGEAQSAMASILHRVLPAGMSFEWTDLAYQQLISGDTSIVVLPLCVIFVFLVLAAQYESLTLPFAIILIMPMCLLAAVAGVWLDSGTSNVFTQVGLIVLLGLACKNAILIVEFAKHLQDQEGLDPVEAVLHAARLRLRPILMTSFAFIMGVVPLMLASGAGAEIRHALGVVVFSGMLGVTFFGLLLTPFLYVLLRRIRAHRPKRAQSDTDRERRSSAETS
ncbi:MAG: efflux RND transporter permease subunit, partial [Steroidobacteraceae bacterium]